MVYSPPRRKGPAGPPSGEGGPRRPSPPSGSPGPPQGLTRIPLPDQVARLIRSRSAAATHPGLLLTRYVRWGEGSSPDEWHFKATVRRSDGKSKEEDLKRENLCRAACSGNGEAVAGLAHAWRTRRAAWLAPLEKEGLACRFTAKTGWRLAVGLAGASPLETNIVFHHLYGTPMLPGSGLKGLALAIARLDATRDECARIFGTQQSAGLVDCLDAIPIPVRGAPLVEVDVMNPHYPRWYRGEKGAVPSDDQNPTPVFFLTVAPGVEFEFALLCRARTPEARVALGKAAVWLREGLNILGAGAKTAAGYGYFLW